MLTSSLFSKRWMIAHMLLGLVCVDPVFSFSSTIHAQESYLFQQVAVFDGLENSGFADVLISDGKIQQIASEIQPDSSTVVIDGTGKTLLPGFIDCHTHVWFESQLRQALVFGVTTELDMMSSPPMASLFRKSQQDGKSDDRADFFSAGAAVTVKNGHGTQFGLPVPTLESAAEAGTFVSTRIREGSDYIKIIYEDGSSYGGRMPCLSKDMLVASIAAAKQNGKLAVAHVSTAEGARLCIENGIDGLVHLFAESEIKNGLVSLAQSKGIFVVPTAAVISNASGKNSTSRLVNDRSIDPFLTNENLANLAKTFPVSPSSKNDWGLLKTNIQRLMKAGVPILAGTDAPNPGTIHGASLHHELRLLVESGLTPTQALAAATGLAARSFQLKDRGRINVGLRADLILVEGDPTEDISRTGNIVGVWKGGKRVDRDSTRKMIAASKASAAQQPKAEENRMISNFESGKRETEFGAGWTPSTDAMMGGNSSVQSKVIDGGADGSGKALQVSGKTRPQQPAFSGVMFSPGKVQMQPGNISSHRSISFWAKGDDEDCEIMFFFQKRGFMPSTKPFKATKQWKKYTFEIKDFDGCDGSDVTGIWFGKTQSGEYQFLLDQVQLEK